MTEDELESLYATKGKLVTNIEIMQGRLNMVNQKLQKELNNGVCETKPGIGNESEPESNKSDSS